ncbi:glutathione S-transferase family protein [Reyranella sp. CPCC 100927]|uniref:glutathione S-transferase family protein n=1 Tax=Reyranella sp. CPCC 100927 TaxID=2599616 RepID=UPI0011B82FE9|nr:glutathione S-transferase family protein [Reyranella sp. CPCC 100927]TWT11822.1 glutathione S-transferase family protein [Reyranella sp. CPCC 100927]
MANEADIVFYHAPQSRSIIAQWMLEELGQPYHLHLLNLKKEEHKQPAYLAVNPMGKVPAIAHKGVIITEAAAICCHLADAYPQAGLNVSVGDPRRGPYLKWLFFGPSCLEPAIIDRMFKRPDVVPGALGYGTFDTTLDVVITAITEGPYLLGEQFTAADVVIGSGLVWGMAVKVVPERPEILAYAARLRERPALQRVYTKDAEFAAAQAA